MNVDTLEPQHKRGLPFSYLPTNGGQHMAPNTSKDPRPFSVGDFDNLSKPDQKVRRTTYVAPQTANQSLNEKFNSNADQLDVEDPFNTIPIDYSHDLDRHISETTYFSYSAMVNDSNNNGGGSRNNEVKGESNLSPRKSVPDRQTDKPGPAANSSLGANEIHADFINGNNYGRKSSETKRRCGCKRFGAAVGILLLMLLSVGGGFIAGWFGHERYVSSLATTVAMATNISTRPTVTFSTTSPATVTTTTSTTTTTVAISTTTIFTATVSTLSTTSSAITTTTTTSTTTTANTDFTVSTAEKPLPIVSTDSVGIVAATKVTTESYTNNSAVSTTAVSSNESTDVYTSGSSKESSAKSNK